MAGRLPFAAVFSCSLNTSPFSGSAHGLCRSRSIERKGRYSRCLPFFSVNPSSLPYTGRLSSGAEACTHVVASASFVSGLSIVFVISDDLST